jgi:tetratricopeptide (TPR) repeat protein
MEFFNLDKINRPIGTSIDAQVYGEANTVRPTDANFWRPPATLVRPGGEANATWALLSRVNADAFLELLQTLRQRREAGILAPPWNPPEANGAPTMAGGRIVELLAGGRIILHSLAGRGRDLVNRNLAEAERKLKAGKFYESAEGFEVAAALSPANPLPRLGRGLALLGAGEPLSAAQEIQAAMETFPVLMEISLDLPSIMGLTALKSRLAELDERLAGPEEDRDPLLPFLACFLHQAQGDVAQAKAFAQQVKEAAPPSRMVQAYAEYVLTGKRPSAQPASEPATVPSAGLATMPAP